jgi:opacity protein-like surface antigen
MRRDMSGAYNWNEYDSESGNLFFGPSPNTLNNSNATVNVFALMSNLGYDFKNDSKWTPFVLAGYGIAWLNSDSSNEYGVLYSDPFGTAVPTPADENSPALTGTAFAWQFKAGVNYAMDTHMSFDLVYRLFGTTQFQQHNGSIVTNSNIPIYRADFVIPQNDINGLLNNSVFVNFRYTFK